jgi:aldehyde:ferredoxin oxidoreductase
MGRREGIGDLLADGAKEAAAKIGRGAEKFAMHVGGEMVPMHDPRCAPGWGATYVSDPTPARHTRGGTQFIEGGMVNPEIFIPWGIKDVPSKLEKYNPAGKGEVHAIMSARQYLVETSGTCLFAADGINFPFIDLMKAVTGWDVGGEELIKTGKRIATLLHAFNLREGFKPKEFTIPPRIAGNPPLKAGALKDVTLDLEGLKRQYYEAMGFDPETGVIRKDRIRELGLQDILL